MPVGDMLGRRDGGTAPVGATDRGQATLLRRSPDDVKEGSKNKVKDGTPSEGKMERPHIKMAARLTSRLTQHPICCEG